MTMNESLIIGSLTERIFRRLRFTRWTLDLLEVGDMYVMVSDRVGAVVSTAKAQPFLAFPYKNQNY